LKKNINFLFLLKKRATIALMLTILFSPSEGKHRGGADNKSELLFGMQLRQDILNAYNSIAVDGDIASQKKMFGLKKPEEFERFASDIKNSLTCKAIERYDGVAYDYLDITTLDANAKAYLEDRLIIFSNLYGPIRGGDLIGEYKVKQGEMVADIAPDRYYKERCSLQLDELLADSDILDLRAGYYDKFYKPSKSFTTLKFIKNGKVVSHWAKAYRGIVLREVAKAGIDSLDAFSKLNIESLHVKEIKEGKLKREIIFDIVD
jgi:cytoplasmic iron level regulating protein YaaA (DUF328/UPF0246 family)